MSLVLADCKGHVHVIASASGGSSAGFYAVNPALPSSADAKALIMGIPLGFREIVQPTVTLDDKRTLYVFGSAWNEAGLSGTLLLGDSSTKGTLLAKLIKWYNSNRVSVKKGPIQLSLGTAAVDAFVIGLRLEAVNPQFNTQAFSLVLLTADVKSTG